VGDYLKQNPRSIDRQALKPFYFCASDTVIMPTPFAAHNLKQFLYGLKRVSVHSIHHHFIEARLRLKLQSNDFSLWLEQAMDMGNVATQLNKIDIYTSTLEAVRLQIAQIVQNAAG
jgi:elongation factor P hydroxylase